MPKRDENYMEQQRDMIARAALKVLVEKGYYETSLRDICRAANVSNGALYSYFPTREAVVVAACAIDHAEQLERALPSCWDEYARVKPEDEMVPGAYSSLRFRLSLQFAAEVSQMAESPEGLGAIFEAHRDSVRRGLLHLKELGLIALPLGIEMTTDLHVQLFQGFEYQRSANHDVERAPIVAALKKGLALTAGRIE